MMFRITLTALLLLASATSVAAQGLAMSFETLTIAPGDEIVVFDRAGTSTQGKLTTLSSDSLSMLVGTTTRQVAEADTLSIRRRGDSLKNGMLVGLAVGGALGVMAITTCGDDCHGGAGRPGAIAFLALEGTTVGILIDWLRRGSTRVYRAP